MDWVRKSFFIFGLWTILGLIGAVLPPEQARAQSIRHLVQMPIAVDKIIQSGYPKHQVRQLQETLNQAKVAPKGVNTLLRSIPYFARRLESLRGAVNYVHSHHNRGLEGQKLLTRVRDELIAQDIDWKTRFPYDNRFLSNRVRTILSELKESIRERRGREEGSPEIQSPSKQKQRRRRPRPGSQRRRRGPGSPY